MADIIPFRSRFQVDAELATTAAALLGDSDKPNDGGRSRLMRRIARHRDATKRITPTIQTVDDTNPIELA